jgi:hypothetical protein
LSDDPDHEEMTGGSGGSQGAALRAQAWWQGRTFVLLALLAAALPMLWPPFAPLTDAPGHIGRYRILVEAGAGPLAHHYAAHWGLIGNLGVDLLVVALHPLLDVEPAARLVIALIPVATVGAMLWAAREAHGRLPASAAFALPLAYSFPFQLGFVNFCLSAAMAIAGLALWLRLARTGPGYVRALAFIPYAGLVWACHSFGWAMLGLFVGGAEWRLRVQAGERWDRAGLSAALMALPMAWPVAIMLSGAGDRLAGDTGDWFHWSAKAQWAISLLRERWKWYDIACVTAIACLLWAAIRSKRFGFSGVLGIPALLSLGAFLALPRLFQGGADVDMRILPYAAALGILAIRVERGHRTFERRLALAASGFYALRTATTTIAFLLFSQGQQSALRAIDALPPGSAVLVLVDEPSLKSWFNPRLSHVAGIAIARRRVFTNEQWALAGQQLIRPLHPRAAPFDADPSQIVHPPGSSNDQSVDFDLAIARFDRCTFQRVWTIGFPAGRAHAADLNLVWSDGRSAVYAVRRPAGCPAG